MCNFLTNFSLIVTQFKVFSFTFFVIEKYGRMIIKMCASMNMHYIKIKWTRNRDLGRKYKIPKK